MKRRNGYGKKGALVGGLVAGGINLYHQFSNKNEGVRPPFDWLSFLKALGKGVVLGGGAGFGLEAIIPRKKVASKPKNADSYLRRLVNNIQLNNDTPAYKIADQKAQFLTTILEKRFKSKLISKPERLGSTARGTAIKSKFDIDIALQFRPHSFRSTARMRFVVLKFLERHVGKNECVSVREQRKSIGVFFTVNNSNFRIDIVPVKITDGNRHSGYLSVTRTSGFVRSYSHQKTSIKSLKSLKLSDTQKRIILVLKYWKTKKEVPIGSHLLENLVIDAYACAKNIPVGFTAKVVMVLKHIANNLDVAVIRGIENTNNVITDIETEKKQEIIEACRNAISECLNHPDGIRSIFQ